MIGVFGGTFNPIHFGHLRSALEITEALRLKQMRFVPCAIPPHRDIPDVSAELRLKMVQAAVENEPRFVVDDCELRRDAPSYSVDTLMALRHRLGDEAIALVVGMDAFLGFHTWHRWREIVNLAHLVVMRRPGHDSRVEKMNSEVKLLVEQSLISDSDQLHRESWGKIWFQEISQLDISATKIRDMVSEGKSARFLLPDEVWAIIEKHHLYR